MKKFFETLPDGGRLLLWFFLIAFTGGASKALLYRRPGVGLLEILAQAFASGFTGFIVGTVLLRWVGEDHVDIVLAVCGVAGWVGPSLMNYFGSIFLNIVHSKAEKIGLDDKKPQ